jgi:hypothetical protein
MHTQCAKQSRARTHHGDKKRDEAVGSAQVTLLQHSRVAVTVGRAGQKKSVKREIRGDFLVSKKRVGSQIETPLQIEWNGTV